MPDALPGSTIGNRVLTLSAWLHYGQGQTLAHVVEVFNHHLQFPLTRGALVGQWYRLQAILYPWYEQIWQEVLESGVLHGDETPLARERQEALAVVLRDDTSHVLLDRPPAKSRRGGAFLPQGVYHPRWSATFGVRTTPSPAERGRSAWPTCCATWNTSSGTSLPRPSGRNSPRNCGVWWAMRSA